MSLVNDKRIPVTIITGFLGSGKTTILNHLLRDPRLTDTAVIVNEFGEIGLDHLLVESAIDQMVLMDNGCLCCTVRGDLVDTLADLMRRAEEGSVPAFSQIMIETTGLADPAPIVQTLITDEDTEARFSLHGIVATVDSVNGADTLAQYDEARCQAAMADLLLITKADMADANVEGVRTGLCMLNPQAAVHTVANGEIDPDVIFSAQLNEHTAHDVKRADSSYHHHGTANAPKHGPEHEPDHGHDHGPDHRHKESHNHHGHLWNIQSASIVIDDTLSWSVLEGWLDWLTSLRGPDVLRIKGIVRVDGFDGPVVVHGVQHVFHSPYELPDWPDQDKRSRIVVIARDIPEAALRHSLQVFRQANTQAAA